MTDQEAARAISAYSHSRPRRLEPHIVKKRYTMRSTFGC